MSRVGKKPIEIPDSVTVKIKGQDVTIKGPKGELSQEIPRDINIELKNKEILVSQKQKTRKSKALWGLMRSLLYNCVEGVTKGFQKELELIGIGYRASVEKEKVLVLEVGFSHKVEIEIPEGINISIKKNIITISGIDKQKIGEIAAKIRKIRPPEPYKGKGIRYLGEKIRRKEGKKAITATT